MLPALRVFRLDDVAQDEVNVGRLRIVQEEASELKKEASARLRAAQIT